MIDNVKFTACASFYWDKERDHACRHQIQMAMHEKEIKKEN